MPTIKYTKEDITKLENELDQYKTAHDKLTAGLKEAVAESIKYKRQRDSLIKDVKKLREEKAAIEMHLDAIKTYKPMYEKLSNKYTNLTEHIKDKALNNPSEHRYFRLVHFIDDLEDE
ncbi:hypothetical protein [Mammaliicoccus sciuri]|uniref:Uncharacterized protein n=1 Tax=Mammaliicoccus sciuri TaxID=1296 RepID=A0AAW5LHJ3_MAMSC|nr:hypothetical protein [Mammaliicoccus sciuri]MCD5141225.1 hypothetical protein [Mammaliicoccus sciuri]MCQ9302674.1 hypothetical protein [Mammaliicoccus sciuri]WQL91857.1 hypothetical protein P3U75_10200 [Mammaliicoccus sciuri]